MDSDLTRKLIDAARSVRWESIPPNVRAVARHCALDWFGVALAGSREPLSQILVRELVCGTSGQASLIGHAARASAVDAALINGAASHALDFDDTHTLMSGHPSAPVLPAALALAERDDCDGASFLAAFIAGVEFECRLGALVNPGHYALGFHATGTLGTFGAAAASAHLLALDDAQRRNAIGLAGTQAAGLKSGFGTMAKPLHAGRAAASGLTSALLARGGFTANPSVVEATQGFASTHGAAAVDAAALDRYEGRYLIADTLFKYHASCYLTHAAIEAARQLIAGAAFTVDDIESVEIRGSAGCIGVCDIPAPATGLEGKFSLRATTAMALLGDDTTDPAAFSDARMRDPSLVAMRDRVTFVPQPGLAVTRATVAVLAGGRSFEAEADTGRPATDLDRQWDALSAKFFALTTPVLGRGRAGALHAAISELESSRSMREITALAVGNAAS